MRENLSLVCVNNIGADQLAFFIRLLESIISKLPISEFLIF